MTRKNIFAKVGNWEIELTKIVGNTKYMSIFSHTVAIYGKYENALFLIYLVIIRDNIKYKQLQLPCPAIIHRK